MQSSVKRIKRIYTWYTDDYGMIVFEDGTRRPEPANHARGRYYNPMAGKRNWGKKPRTRTRRGPVVKSTSRCASNAEVGVEVLTGSPWPPRSMDRTPDYESGNRSSTLWGVTISAPSLNGKGTGFLNR